jgi:ubiquitin C-terminal hydrolase
MIHYICTVARGKKALRKALAAVKKSTPHVTTRRESQPPKTKRKEHPDSEFKENDDHHQLYETPPVSTVGGVATVDFSSLIGRKKRRMGLVDGKSPVSTTVVKDGKEATMNLLSLDVTTMQEKNKRLLRDVSPRTGGTRLTPLFVHCAVPRQNAPPLTTDAAIEEDEKEKKSTKANNIVKTAVVCKAPIGFSNLGNTCYLNATIQCMLNVPAFVHEIQKNAENSKETSVTRALSEIVKQGENKESVTLTSLARVKSALECHFPSVFAGTNQQDAHECFVRILEALELEHPDSYECPFSFNVSVEMRCKNCKHKTLIEEGGNVDIGLDLPSSCPEELSIERLLTVRYFKAERIHKNCDGCGDKDVVHGLRRRLLTHPKALVIHLKRFVFHAPTTTTKTSSRWAPTFSKNASIVQVPQNLSRTSLMISSGTDMSLSGIVHHHGSRVESGHYIADVYREPSSWYRCNDSIVTKAPPSLASSTCYMAMYTQM